MDKRKLVQIIVKDLEELKVLSEEVADSQHNSSLVIDLALSKARLLTQEIELLRELAGNSGLADEPSDEDRFDGDDEDLSAVSFPDPELEIINFENDQFTEPEDLNNEEEDPENDEDLEESDDDDLDDFEDEDPESEVDNEEEPESDDLTEDLEDEDLEDEEDDFSEEEEEVDDEESNLEIEEEKPLVKTNIQVTELKNDPHSEVREINIDDPDDDFEPVHFSNPSGPATKPQMREIPKPENPVIGETFQKERSLNDSIGENKSVESKLTNGPITSLGAAIGLNDRFLFTREIFNNNSEKFKAVIEHLDKLESIQQAVEYLKANLSMEKNEASLKFVELLKRRFTK